MALLVRGLRGEPVKLLQAKLGVEADGIFGKGTERALEAFQKEHGLSEDGVAGPDTFVAMGLYELVLLKRGSKGATVAKLQAGLGIDADGKFGGGTEKSVRTYQQDNELQVDGIAGPDTLGKLGVLTLGGAEAQAVVGAGVKLWESIDEATSGAMDRVKGLFG